MASSSERQNLTRCQAAIGYNFEKIDLLRAALTHSSGANTRLASNERLEFLGDSVLGLVASARLFERFPTYDEGELTRVKSIVVSRKCCARFSRELGLGSFLILGKGMRGEIPMNMLADAFESLVAAIFLDRGWDHARDFVLRFVEPEIDRTMAGGGDQNGKSELQQVAQREFGVTPRYVLLDEQGEDHYKCFKIAAVVKDHAYPPAWGTTKKNAEAKAAQNALAELNGESIPHPTN